MTVRRFDLPMPCGGWQYVEPAWKSFLIPLIMLFSVWRYEGCVCSLPRHGDVRGCRLFLADSVVHLTRAGRLEREGEREKESDTTLPSGTPARSAASMSRGPGSDNIVAGFG